jgi:OmpA-OmpF porin, OOP family
MSRAVVLRGLATCCLVTIFLLDGTVKAESVTLAEEHAAAAREQAELAQEAADRAALAAVLAEKQVTRTGQRSTSTRIAELERELAQLKPAETEHGLALTFGDVLFAPNQAELTPSAMRELYALVTILKAQPQRTIYIEGYTDSRGTEFSNLDLAQRRADAVRDFLIDNGISSPRIIARGYGEGDPVAANATAAGRQENRRVEVIVPREGRRVAAETR